MVESELVDEKGFEPRPVRSDRTALTRLGVKWKGKRIGGREGIRTLGLLVANEAI